MKLWKVRIKTYRFGNHYYYLYVLADTEDNMIVEVKKNIRSDDEAEIVNYKEIDLTDKTNRIL